MPRKKTTQIISCLILVGIFYLSAHAAPAGAFAAPERVAYSKSLAHYTMGQIYDLLGMTNRAVLEYEKAAQFDDKAYMVRLRLGTDYARLNMLDEAVRELKIVQALSPDELQSHYLLALIYSSRKDYDLAAQEYEYILKSFSAVEPQNVEIYGYLAQLYYSQRKYDQAIEQFEKILSLEPENADVLYLLGSLYLEVNKRDTGVELLKRSLAINPDHDGSLNALGYQYAEEGVELDEAKRLIERALVISPDNGAYLDSLGWVYYQKGMYNEALEYLVKAQAVLADPVIFEHLGDIYLKLNKFEEASKSWEESLKLSPDQETVRKKLDEIKSMQAGKQKNP